MGRVDSMKAVGREIKGAYDERQAVLGSIRHEVADSLDEKRLEHRNMADNLRKDLSKSMSDLRRDVSNLRNSYRNMIRGIKKEHQEVVNAWHDLVSIMQSKRGMARA